MKKFFLVFFILLCFLKVQAGEATTNDWTKDLQYRSSDPRLSVCHDGLSESCERVFEKEREFRSKPPSSIRGLVVALMFLELYNEDTWRQPGHLSAGGVNKDRVRVGDKMVVHRKGTARGFVWKSETLGERADVFFPAIVKAGSRSPGIAVSWYF